MGMKKIYNSPATETVNVQMMCTLCDSVNNVSTTGTGGGDTGRTAPQRRLF